MQTQPYDDECPACGGTLEILTNSKEPNMGYDGDLVQCLECPWQGYLSVDEDGNAELND